MIVLAAAPVKANTVTLRIPLRANQKTSPNEATLRIGLIAWCSLAWTEDALGSNDHRPSGSSRTTRAGAEAGTA